MNERQRHAWLKAFELTPWVARRPLPGAAASLEPDWPEEEAGLLPEAQAPGTSGTAPVPQRPAPKQAEPQGTDPASPGITAPGAPGALRVTLQAHQAGDIWVLAEQSDPGAPDLGREALRLLQNILRLFPGGGARRTFVWPMGGGVPDESAAGPAFRSFVTALASGGRASRVLLCADAATTRTLAGGERFEPARDGDLVLLPVASLDEMLADPVNAKRRTWQAMVRAGFRD